MECKEKAVFFSKFLDLRKLSDYKRVYLGSEFCENLLPQISLVEDVISECSRQHLGYTLVTPYLTNKGMEKLARLTEYFARKEEKTEIVINDWSVLKLLQRHPGNFEIILGRILVSQYLSKFHFSESAGQIGQRQENPGFYCLFPESLLSLLEKNNIFCLEFNIYSHLASTSGQLKEKRFKAHLHFPFAYLTTSRFCGCAGGYRSLIHNKSDECAKECEKSIAVIKNKNLNKSIFVKGNTYFIRQDESENGPDYLPDRIVYNDFLAY